MPELKLRRFIYRCYICRMYFLYLKSIHIIFIVTWFAGLFYMPRLFIYDVEARSKNEPENHILVNQFRIMQKRLWFGITWPSMILTLILGPWIVIEAEHIQWSDRWLIIKLCLVVGLILYHLSLHVIFKQLGRDIVRYSSNQLRIWNEFATLFLVAIVFLVELQNELDMLYGILGLLVFVGVLMLAIKLYKHKRLQLEKKQN